MAGSSFNSSTAIRNILGGGAKRSAPPYFPSRSSGRKKKPPKRYTFDVTIYNNPGEDVLATSEIKENSLSKIGIGTIMLYEDNSAEQVKVEMLKLLASFSSLLADGIEFENIDFIYLKKDGRKKQFQKRYCSSSFIYDAIGRKDISGKDSKHLYLVASKIIPFKKN